MAWSKVKKGRKPIKWWYYKIICEFGYAVRNIIGTYKIYYKYLNKMCDEFKINLYGERLNH
jgi:hypothetical protein